MFGSQHRIPKHLFFLVFWVSTADFGFSAGRRRRNFSDIFLEVPVTRIRVSAPAPYKSPTITENNCRCWEDVGENHKHGPGTPKSLQKVSGTVRKDSSDTFRRLSGDFSDCSRDILEAFRGSGVRDFFGISGPTGPRDLCKGRAGYKVGLGTAEKLLNNSRGGPLWCVSLQ